MNKQITTISALITTVFFWGLSFIAIKIVLTSFSPILYMFLRFSLASLLFLFILLIQGFPRLDRHTHFRLFLTGLFEPGLYFYFETLGLTRTTASNASIILATTPIMVMVLARIFLGEQIHRKSIYAIILSIAGMCLLAISESGTSGGTSSLLGDLLILAAASSAACYIVCAKDLGNALSSLVITSFQVFYGTFMFLPFFIYKYSSLNWNAITLKSLLALIFLALFCTVGGYFLYNYALTKIPATRASLFLNGVPVVTTLAAVPVLGEHLTYLQIIGGILVLTAVFAANLPSNHPLKESQQKTTKADVPANS